MSTTQDMVKDNGQPMVIGQEDTSDAGRNVTFNLNNELTRRYEEEAIAGDYDPATGASPPAYSRSHRDSGVSVSGDKRDSSLLVGPRPTHTRTLSSGSSVSLGLRRLSSGTDEGRRMSLGPAMDQWRLEEEEALDAARRNGEEVPTLLPPPLSPRTSSPWPSNFPTRSTRPSFSQEDGRRMSLGVAMDQWRVEEEDELEQAKRSGRDVPTLLTPPPMSPRHRPQSKWPSQFPTRSARSSFDQGDGRPTSLGLAMEQWRLEELEGTG